MIQNAPVANEGQGGLVDAPRLLETLFPDPRCRPSVRWLRTHVAERTVPFIRIGHLCFFDPAKVREALNSQRTAKFGGVR